MCKNAQLGWNVWICFDDTNQNVIIIFLIFLADQDLQKDYWGTQSPKSHQLKQNNASSFRLVQYLLTLDY